MPKRAPLPAPPPRRHTRSSAAADPAAAAKKAKDFHAVLVLATGHARGAARKGWKQRKGWFRRPVRGRKNASSEKRAQAAHAYAAGSVDLHLGRLRMLVRQRDAAAATAAAAVAAAPAASAAGAAAAAAAAAPVDPAAARAPAASVKASVKPSAAVEMTGAPAPLAAAAAASPLQAAADGLADGGAPKQAPSLAAAASAPEAFPPWLHRVVSCEERVSAGRLRFVELVLRKAATEKALDKARNMPGAALPAMLQMQFLRLHKCANVMIRDADTYAFVALKVYYPAALQKVLDEHYGGNLDALASALQDFPDRAGEVARGEAFVGKNADVDTDQRTIGAGVHSQVANTRDGRPAVRTFKATSGKGDTYYLVAGHAAKAVAGVLKEVLPAEHEAMRILLSESLPAELRILSEIFTTGEVIFQGRPAQHVDYKNDPRMLSGYLVHRVPGKGGADFRGGDLLLSD